MFIYRENHTCQAFVNGHTCFSKLQSSHHAQEEGVGAGTNAPFDVPFTASCERLELHGGGAACKEATCFKCVEMRTLFAKSAGGALASVLAPEWLADLRIGEPGLPATIFEALFNCTCHGPRVSGAMPEDVKLADIRLASACGGDWKAVPILFGGGKEFIICITLGECVKSRIPLLATELDKCITGFDAGNKLGACGPSLLTLLLAGIPRNACSVRSLICI